MSPQYLAILRQTPEYLWLARFVVSGKLMAPAGDQAWNRPVRSKFVGSLDS